ncbi:Crp/Fnr family transcriptional regulator [Roseivirga sp. E12]|uniref:Crp/Fnr family transcriptional regulator n=1 Tax=Roseivirga sp. E12 TaxID=2819237 RepID=UPI001ABC8C45|nr:Crp/Fnr family transcriptional regulator [Roseivirga sp. E12]MBO3698255.1 Crp/Fnr family transcriptional regulator [Roseivirga sp. E12]
MDNSNIWYLEQFDFWKVLKDEDIKFLDERLTKRTIKQDDIIRVEEYNYIYFLKSGIMKLVYLDEDGNERIKSLRKPGTIFGELNITSQTDKNVYAIAKEDAVVCLMTRDEFNYILDKNNALKVEVIKTFSERIHKLEKLVNDLVFKSSEERIIDFLMSFRDEFGESNDKGLMARNFISHDEIAKLTSTSRQFVTKTLNKLKKQGCVTYDNEYFYFHGSLEI